MSLFTTRGRSRKKKRRIPDDAFYTAPDTSAAIAAAGEDPPGKVMRETRAKPPGEAPVRRASDRQTSDKKTLVKLNTKRTGKSISGSALMGKASLMVALGLVLLMGIGYLLTLLFSKSGTFTVKAQGLNDINKRIALSETIGFANPTAKLDSIGISSMDNITYDWLPLDELDAYDGAYNGENYIVYTFYVKNTGKEDLEYRAELYYTKATRGIENAARVMIYYNGEPTVYAAPSADGGTEIVPVGLTDFYDDTTVSHDIRSLAVDECDRYTVVVWLEGEDPECIDDVRSGTLAMEMDFDVLDDEGNPLNGDVEMARGTE